MKIINQVSLFISGRPLILSLLSAIFLMANASKSHAESECEMRPGSVEYLESIKNDFYHGKYREFIEEADAHTQSSPEERWKLERLLNENFSNGFVSCTTLVTEVISDRLVSEITLFEPSHGNYVFVSWVAINHNGHWGVVKYAVTTEFETAKSIWR